MIKYWKQITTPDKSHDKAQIKHTILLFATLLKFNSMTCQTSKATREKQARKENQQRRFPYHRVPIPRNWYEEFARELCAKNPCKEPTALYV